MIATVIVIVLLMLLICNLKRTEGFDTQADLATVDKEVLDSNMAFESKKAEENIAKLSVDKLTADLKLAKETLDRVKKEKKKLEADTKTKIKRKNTAYDKAAKEAKKKADEALKKAKASKDNEKIKKATEVLNTVKGVSDQVAKGSVNPSDAQALINASAVAATL